MLRNPTYSIEFIIYGVLPTDHLLHTHLFGNIPPYKNCLVVLNLL